MSTPGDRETCSASRQRPRAAWSPRKGVSHGSTAVASGEGGTRWTSLDRASSSGGMATPTLLRSPLGGGRSYRSDRPPIDPETHSARFFSQRGFRCPALEVSREVLPLGVTLRVRAAGRASIATCQGHERSQGRRRGGQCPRGSERRVPLPRRRRAQARREEARAKTCTART